MEWISVKDRLPDEGVRVLCNWDDKVNIVHYDKQAKTYYTDDYFEIKIEWLTYWMPLPELSKDLANSDLEA